ncbi:hypothetical protein ACLQ18_07220 [Streptomyces sp. DT193]|uniref:hypothetical protein n=1 Tax=Streptomyces sp. DT193 TaxID=3393418 RepID=UPI003CE706A0
MTPSGTWWRPPAEVDRAHAVPDPGASRTPGITGDVRGDRAAPTSMNPLADNR